MNTAISTQPSLADYVREIASRGGEVAVKGHYNGESLGVIHTDGELTLVGLDAWKKYGRRQPARFVKLRYLCGVDDNGIFAVRVAGTVDTVHEAVDFLEPAAVKKARAAGRQVLRQGDVYAVQQRTRRYDGMGDLPAAHTWDPETRTLTHLAADGRPHAPLHLPLPVRFYQQRTYQMGSRRRARWGGGD